MNFKQVFAAGLIAVTGLSQAGVVVGGAALVNAAGLTQLETWLGQGELTLTNIFTKTPGATSVDFHAAADGIGPTFSLMSVSEDSGITWKTIGGYNPLSWNSISGYTFSDTGNTATYSAFIFNLTDGFKLDQTNSAQTYNDLAYGPTFGGGNDIYVASNLTDGYSFGYSYGDALSDGGVFGPLWGVSLVDGLPSDNVNSIVRELEVFSIGQYVGPGPGNQVPEPGTLALALAGLSALAIILIRRKSVVTNRT